LTTDPTEPKIRAGDEKCTDLLQGDPRHLRGRPAVEEMKKIGPDFIAPTPCTGWKAINEFARGMPDPFILISVGIAYLFKSR